MKAIVAICLFMFVYTGYTKESGPANTTVIRIGQSPRLCKRIEPIPVKYASPEPEEPDLANIPDTTCNPQPVKEETELHKWIKIWKSQEPTEEQLEQQERYKGYLRSLVESFIAKLQQEVAEQKKVEEIELVFKPVKIIPKKVEVKAEELVYKNNL